MILKRSMICLFLLAGGCKERTEREERPANTTKDDYGTALTGSYYWDLPLKDPDTAALTFMRAMSEEDYLTGYLIVSNEFLRGWKQAVRELNAWKFFGLLQRPENDSEWYRAFVAGDREHLGNWYLFEIAMRKYSEIYEDKIEFYSPTKEDLLFLEINDTAAKVTYRGPDGGKTIFFMEQSTHKRWRLVRIRQTVGKAKYNWPTYLQ